MTEAIPVHIYFLLDRTGSMRKIASDVVGGLNTFLDQQRAEPGKCRLTLVQFDDAEPHEVIHDAVKIADVPAFDQFIPRGMTPLLDAEGRLIARAEKREAERAAAGKKAEAIMFATFTDGLENASHEWTKEALVAKRAELEARGWSFLYLGVGHDGYGQAAAHGYQAQAVSSFVVADSTSVGSTYGNMTRSVANVRNFAAKGERIASSQLLEEDPAALPTS